MIEQIFKMAVAIDGKSDKVVEKVLHDENVHFNHMLLNQGEALPEHYSNSTVYMAVIQGKLSLILDNQDTQMYPTGTLLKIPNDIKMNVMNTSEALLELIVVKAPAPTTPVKMG